MAMTMTMTMAKILGRATSLARRGRRVTARTRGVAFKPPWRDRRGLG
jgi:hypothetical protein